MCLNGKKKYEQTLNWLFIQLPMYQRVGTVAMKKDLGNIRKLCKQFRNPQEEYPSIHIAGTNGKGSTAHLIAAVLQQSDYKVGLYTSPHYKDFRERIKVDGQLMSRNFVIDFVEKNRSFFKDLKPSFFEITVAMAFQYFAEQKVDVAIIETGLGGRLDSTNIIRPMLSVITNISFDHQQFLGNTLPLIAKEKAGIIKKNIPVIIGETQKEIESVFIKTANKKNATILFADQNYQVELIKTFKSYSQFSIKRKGKKIYEKIPIQIHGRYQEKNIATALQTIELLQKLKLFNNINTSTIQKALKQFKNLTRFIGRWQIIGNQPTIICDSAHNEAGIQLIMSQLSELSFQEIHFVLGFVNDKDLDKLFCLFPKDAKYYFAKANIPRGMPAAILQKKANKFDLKGRKYVSVKYALAAAKRAANKKDLIYVGGSIFVVAEVI